MSPPRRPLEGLAEMRRRPAVCAMRIANCFCYASTATPGAPPAARRPPQIPSFEFRWFLPPFFARGAFEPSGDRWLDDMTCRHKLTGRALKRSGKRREARPPICSNRERVQGATVPRNALTLSMPKSRTSRSTPRAEASTALPYSGRSLRPGAAAVDYSWLERQFCHSTEEDSEAKVEDERVGSSRMVHQKTPANGGRQWSSEEDELLLAALDQYGPKWTAVAHAVGHERTQAMCRNRYQRMMAPNQGKRALNRSTAGESRLGHACKEGMPSAAGAEQPARYAETSAQRRREALPAAAHGVVDTLAPLAIQRPHVRLSPALPGVAPSAAHGAGLHLTGSLNLMDDFDAMTECDEDDGLDELESAGALDEDSLGSLSGEARFPQPRPPVMISSHAAAYAALATLGESTTQHAPVCELMGTCPPPGGPLPSPPPLPPSVPSDPLLDLAPPTLAPSHSFLAESLFPGTALRCEGASSSSIGSTAGGAGPEPPPASVAAGPAASTAASAAGGSCAPATVVSAAKTLSSAVLTELDFTPSSLFMSDLLGLSERPSSPPPALGSLSTACIDSGSLSTACIDSDSPPSLTDSLTRLASLSDVIRLVC